MASRLRLLPVRQLPMRLCALMVALLLPAFAGAGPALDLKELRATLRAAADQPVDRLQGVPDVAALRVDLGLRAAPVATPGVRAPKPAQGFGGAGGLFSLQSAQTKARNQLQTIDQPGAKPVKAALDVGMANFRVMLATLSQTYTAQNNQLLINAQGPRGAQALSVRAGRVTLADLQRFSALNGMTPLEDGTLTGPVILWPDATLVITQGQRLALSRDNGAFIMSMGRIEITGAVVEATGPENTIEPTFKPFITVVAGGALVVKSTSFRGLGFGRTDKFAGLTVAGNPLMPTDDPEISITGSLFDDVRSVAIAGVPDVQITGNTFQNAGSAALTLLGTPDALVRENLFRGSGPTNAVRVQFGSDRVAIDQNVFLQGARVAILVDRGSTHVSVTDNLIWDRDGAGIKFLGTQCGRAEGNILLDNAQKGIEVRKSDGTVVQGNTLAGNQSAGIWVSAQAADARTSVRGNRFVGNGAGLSSATGAQIWVADNNFQKQLPKILDGDIAALSNALVRDLSGASPLLFNRGQSLATNDVAPLCGDAT